MYMNLLKTDRLAMAYYLFFMAYYLDENNGVKDIRTIFGQFMLFFLMYVGTMSAYLLFSSLMCSKKFAAMVLLLKPGADPGEVKRVNFHPPFSEPPSFFFFFLIPQILIGSNTLLQKFTPHLKILDPRLHVYLPFVTLFLLLFARF